MKMLIISFILVITLGNTAHCQDQSTKEVKTEVSEVTVFIKGAQVTRKKSIEVTQGVTIFKFNGLSPFIDAKSIRLKADGNITVLSVIHQQNYLERIEKPSALTLLESGLEQVEKNIKLERTYLDIIAEELAFLKENRDISGRMKEITVASLKEASGFYSTSLRTLKLKEIDHLKNIEELSSQKYDLEFQMKMLTSKKEYPSGEILVKVAAKNTTIAVFELSYLVNNASWFPTYDIRAKNVNEPIELVYKANVRQDTKENWNNVKLRFSSSDPNKTGLAPELKTSFLNYNTLPPQYGNDGSTVSGRVFDASTKEGLPGVNVMVQGSMIGTVTDIKGNYSLTIPNNASGLVFSYIGYLSQNIPISGSNMNIAMAQDISTLNEEVVVGYGTQKKVANPLQGVCFRSADK
jgi:hypothetical protein